jgi:hypothetical protein
MENTERELCFKRSSTHKGLCQNNDTGSSYEFHNTS